MTKAIGIDPGLAGAIAVIDDKHLLPLQVYDMPTMPGSKGKKVIDLTALVNIIETIVTYDTHVIIEQQQPMPGQGVTSTYNIGYNYGLIMGSLRTHTPFIEAIRAKEWKKYYPDLAGLNRKDQKAMARMIATDMYPNNESLFALVKHDGRAEATLLASIRHTKDQEGLQ